MSGTSIEVSVTGLGKGFGGAPVLDRVDMIAGGGALTLVVGPPGSGKTTLVRCLTGVYRADCGAVTYRVEDRGTVDLTASDARTVAWLRTHHIAAFDSHLPAAPRLPAALAAARSARCSRSSAVAALDSLRMSGLAQVPIGRLRDPERLTVALGAALLAERPFVFLDEPERFADRASLEPWLGGLTDSGAVVVATAAPDSTLESLAAVTGHLRKGTIEWRTP